jgi:polar amino acid transport system substrate-binding protein
VRPAAALVVAAALSLLAAGCGGGSKSSEGGTSTATSSCAKDDLTLVSAGELTVGTDNPAYPPWFGGGTPKGSTWKINDPSTGKGFESAVAYAVADQLGFGKGEVKWTVVPFNTAFAPGKKKFDLDINQISFKPARARAVDFSSSYYDVNQAIVVVNGTKIANVDSVAGLKPHELGAQLGTTSYDTIVGDIKPSKKPAVFDTNDAAVTALKNRQIDGLVVDLPTAFYVSAAQVPNSKVLGQFPPQPGGEHFGMVLAKGSSLTHCVDQALSELRADGTLDRLRQEWLSRAVGAPVLK